MQHLKSSRRVERKAIIASRDFDGLRQRLDRSASTTRFTQAMAEFYLGIPRRQFDQFKREHGNPFLISKSTPRSIAKVELLTWYAQVTKAREHIQEPISGNFGRTGKGVPFIVIRASAGKIKSVISHAGITGLDMSVIEEAFQQGATILALTIDQALAVKCREKALAKCLPLSSDDGLCIQDCMAGSPRVRRRHEARLAPTYWLPGASRRWRYRRRMNGCSGIVAISSFSDAAAMHRLRSEAWHVAKHGEQDEIHHRDQRHRPSRPLGND